MARDFGIRYEGRSDFGVGELDYTLPGSLIAQRPAPRRDGARMLVVDRATGILRDHRIVDLPELLKPGDLLVLNDTKVIQARFAVRRATGGAVRGLFIQEEEPGRWEVMLEGSRRLRVGELLSVEPTEQKEGVKLELEESCGEGQWLVRVVAAGTTDEILARIGRTPLPPYIRRDHDAAMSDAEDRVRYQTVYAAVPGAIAAPTAGLHLTEHLLESVRRFGVETAFVTLHVGVGTFKPIAVDCLSRHVMHPERYELPPHTADAVRACRERGGRVVAVGTTSVRVLESAASQPIEARFVEARRGVTELFIYPPFSFRVVDALLTNFHLPRSTLLAMVMAFAGVDTIRRAYRHAVEDKYRFYSYGDAMLID